MTSDPTPDRHREAREALRPILLTMSGETVDETLDRLLTALSPAGPEEPREGLRADVEMLRRWRGSYVKLADVLDILDKGEPADREVTAVIQGARAAVRDATDALAAVLAATTPAPDTGAGEPNDPRNLGMVGRTAAAARQYARARADTGAEERLRAALREAIKADLTALAHWSTEDWQERGRGADPIARTINAARDIVDARFDEHDRG